MTGDRQALERDLSLGLRQRVLRQRLPWSLTWEEAHVLFPSAPEPDHPFEHRIGPVLLGALEIDALFATRTRPDAPIANWEATVVLSEGDAGADETRLLDHFGLLGAPDPAPPARRAGETATAWTRNGVRLAVYGCKEGCRVRLVNDRPCPELLTDPYCDFVRAGEVDACTFPIQSFRMSADWRVSPQVRATPAGLLDLFEGGDAMLVWRDDDGERLGFADREHACVYARTAVEGLALTRIRPERAPAWASLSVRLTGEVRGATAGRAGFDAFDPWLQDIAALLRLPVRTELDYIE